MLAQSYEGGRRKVEMKFSFPFSMAVLNRFLSQAEVYLKEDSHHKIMEIFSLKVEE